MPDTPVPSRPKGLKFANFGEMLYWSYANYNMLWAAFGLKKNKRQARQDGTARRPGRENE